jgi:hypothetical protein
MRRRQPLARLQQAQQQSRFYSLQLALQLKARMAGIPTPVFGATSLAAA